MKWIERIFWGLSFDLVLIMQQKHDVVVLAGEKTYFVGSIQVDLAESSVEDSAIVLVFVILSRNSYDIFGYCSHELKRAGDVFKHEQTKNNGRCYGAADGDDSGDDYVCGSGVDI